ncbi:hypothetical protein Nepgr_028164 [Nepenthes gracilis]|uniref:C2H2-type domain-containing protein n=1 Tax=Nepenthes gracilis TaxID=150966 RepID=A0AAD3TBX7_NEPGR|nr:hypothetical protein Nepgr_028164 [Nepenthes gracilis]
MEFWGVEVKSGEPMKVEPGTGMILHISQACLGEVKKDKSNEYVHLYANKDGQKFLLGNLSLEKFPHLNFDLVFEDDFELSHDWKHGNEEESDDDLGEPVHINAVDNGKPEAKQEKPATDKANAAVKSGASAAKQKVKIVEPNKDAKEDEGDDDSDEDDEDDFDEDEDMPNAGDESDDDDDDDDDSEEGDDKSDEETPKKAEPGKKRPAESAAKTPSSDKKAKSATPQKTDGKKAASVHVATPHPSKRPGKPPTPANGGNPKQQAPKSGGSFTCNSCARTFGSEQALQSHSKAKHAAKRGMPKKKKEEWNSLFYYHAFDRHLLHQWPQIRLAAPSIPSFGNLNFKMSAASG